MTTCLKCGATSGDGWSQCQGSCPMTMSPHHNFKAIVEEAKRWLASDDPSDAIEAANMFAQALVDLATPVLTVPGNMDPEVLKQAIERLQEIRNSVPPIQIIFDNPTREQVAAAGFEDDSPEYRAALAAFEEDGK